MTEVKSNKKIESAKKVTHVRPSVIMNLIEHNSDKEMSYSINYR